MNDYGTPKPTIIATTAAAGAVGAGAGTWLGWVCGLAVAAVFIVGGALLLRARFRRNRSANRP